MSRPRHLWSGDWESDSAAVTEELDRRRGEIQAPAETRAEDPAQPAGPSAITRALIWLRHQLHAGLQRRNAHRRQARDPARERAGSALLARRRGLRMALLAVLVGLLSAAVAYAVTTLLVGGSGSQNASAASRGRPWLGVDLDRIPADMIAFVVPGSPAASAGLAPGDTITAIGGTQVSTTAAVQAAVEHLHVGSQVQIQYTLGLASYTTQLTVGTEPPGYP